MLGCFVHYLLHYFWRPIGALVAPLTMPIEFLERCSEAEKLAFITEIYDLRNGEALSKRQLIHFILAAGCWRLSVVPSSFSWSAHTEKISFCLKIFHQFPKLPILNEMLNLVIFQAVA